MLQFCIRTYIKACFAKKTMNTFYIFIYYELFKEFEFVRYLINHPTAHSLKESFCSFIIKQTLKTFHVENIVLYTHLSTYIKELTHKESCDQKYKIFSSIYKNPFLNDNCRDKILGIFCKIQKRYLALCRFAYICKLRKAHICVETDLYLNQIEPSKSNSFVLFQNNQKYYFIVSDLIKILEYAVCHEWEDEFDIISKKPCNPYNKQPLLKHDLFNIYFHMRFNMRVVIPSFFHLWFLEGFDLSSLLIKHGGLLRKICIKHHVFNVSNTSNMLYKDIRIMLFQNNYTRKWCIHEDFPRETLVDLMRPYLYIFYLIYYDVFDNEELVWYEAVLSLELMKCYKFNPLFGRRTIKPRSTGVRMNHVFWRKTNGFDFLDTPNLKVASSPAKSKHTYVFNTKIRDFKSASY